MSVPGEVATFVVWDYVVIGGVLLVSASIGIFHALAGGRQKTSSEFLLADRNMNPIPVAFSLSASFVSAVTVLGTPAEVYRYGTMYWLICISFVITGIVVARTFMTIFYEHEITSTNEYLERRFHKNVRYLGTALFYLQMILYLGIVIYAPALALNAVTGITLWGSVLTIGAVCAFYTSIGGLKAVLWTDVFQVCIMLSGLLAVIIEGSIRLGGLREAWQVAESRGRIDFWNFNPNPTIRNTFWSVAIGNAFTWIATYGTNQAQVQRYLSCGKKSTANWALGVAVCGMIILVSVTCLTGVVMFAYYADCDPITMGYVSASDQLLPYFVMDLFGDKPGLPGLVTSCIFCAALSTVSSGLNALATMTGEDILKSIWPNISDNKYTIATKIIAFSFGAVAILVSYLASKSDAILQATISIFGLVGGPLLGLFSLGAFFPCVNSYGAFFGTLVGMSMAFWVGVGAILYPPDTNPHSLSTEMCIMKVNGTLIPDTTIAAGSDDEYPAIASFYSLSYLWYCGFAWGITVCFGLLISFATGHNDPKKADPTLHRPIVDSFFCCFPETCTDVCRCGVVDTVEDSDNLESVDITRYAEKKDELEVGVEGISSVNMEEKTTSF